MNSHMENHKIVNHNEFLLLQQKKIITNIVELQNDKELLSFFDDHDWSEEEGKTYLNISVPIFAAIIVSSRIHMSQFKTMKDLSLYYTETESIYINKPLEVKYIGSELGKIKHEQTNINI
uniref:DNA polymerase n=1 Tax=Tricholoma saponaceum TaxID=113602 RepID=A0A6C0W4Z5_9AGAR|nr:DNA polymerase [Tricholoma saponaceum]QIC20314.1 DNA polymerase [Tricholoma saponaceum]